VVELVKPTAGVVEHPVDDDADVARVSGVEHLVKSRVAAEDWVYAIVVVRVVAMIGGGLENRREVDSRDAKFLQVIQVLHDAQQVAPLEPINRWPRVPCFEVVWFCNTCGAGKAIREYLVENCVFDPIGNLFHSLSVKSIKTTWFH